MNKKKIIFVILTVACIAFIWINSSMDANESSELSGGVLGLINSFIMNMGIEQELSENIIRKTAHFTEYAVLAVLLTTDFKLFKADMRNQGFMVPFTGLLIAAVDETIQLFPAGRSSSVVDVWIDFGGVCAGFLIALAAYKIMEKSK